MVPASWWNVIAGVVVVLWNIGDTNAQDVFSCGGFIKSAVKIDFSKIKVKLFSPEGNLKYETDCAPNNGYYMIPVYSKGKYVLRVTPPNGWKFAPESQDLLVDGQEDPCSKGEDINFQFAGFSLIGKIVNSDGKAASRGVQVSLTHKGTNKHIQSVQSDQLGVYTFPAVLPGEYDVRCGQDSRICVEESRLSVQVAGDMLLLDTPFKIYGYPLSGRVLNNGQGVQDVNFLLFAKTTLDAKGGGVEGAEISLNGKALSRTDKAGSFVLEQVSSGNYKIEVGKEDVDFPPLTLNLSPKDHAIPPIIVSKFQMCGRVELKNFPDSVPKMTQRKLLVTNKGTGEVVSVTTDRDGKFCRILPRGKYVLEPQILPKEREAGLSLLPERREVVLEERPVMDVLFSQFQASINGLVQCSVPCKGVGLGLVKDGQRVNHLSLNPKQQMQKFTFVGLLPGTYHLMLTGYEYCWDKTESVEKIVEADIQGVVFRQTGFALRVSTDSQAHMHWEFGGNKVIKGHEFLNKGQNRFCLPVDGEYELRLSSCHKFPREVYKYNTAQTENSLTLTATNHLLAGKITMRESTDDIVMEIRSGGKEEPLAVLGPLKGKRETNESTSILYPYEYYAGIKENLILTPKSKVFLFQPPQASLTLEDDCVLNGPGFLGERGLFLKGQVSPPLPDVKVTLLRRTETSGQQEFHAVTDNKGSYSVGPLRNFDGFTYAAEKEGYILTPEEDSPGHFRAMKLSELTISVVDLEGKGLSGVLLSVSGGLNYRSNNLTKESGELNFVGLSPGEYFIRPVLKEYSFQPSTKMVTVKEGSVETVSLVGKRVAFSVRGRVGHLAGQAVGDVVVEAVSEDCNQLQEEDRTGEEGVYRVRGLHPGCTYHLRLKHHPDITGTIPKHFLIQVVDKDVTEKDFLLKPQITTMELAGRIVTEEEYLPSVKVVIAREDQPDSPTHTIQIHHAGSFYVHNIPIDDAVYIVRLESTLSKTQFKDLPLPWATFKANSSLHFVKLEFNPKKKSVEAEISKSGYIVLPLAILLGFLVYNQAKVPSFISHV